MNRVARRLLDRGMLNFCDCKDGTFCKSYRPAMALMCKFIELCLLSQSLGFNTSLSTFGVGSKSQKTMSVEAYRHDPDLNVYVLTDIGRARLTDRPGSDVIFPAAPLSLFDCVEMTEPPLR